MPHYSICGFRPADEVGTFKGLRDGPKRLYSLLVRRAGKRDHCWPGYAKLSNDLGKGARQVRNDLYALMKWGLITAKQRGLRRSNSYQFLFHEEFLKSVDRQDSAGLERQSSADRIPEVGIPQEEEEHVLEPLATNASHSQPADPAYPLIKAIVRKRTGHHISDQQIDKLTTRATAKAGRPVGASECAAVAQVFPLPRGGAKVIRSAEWWVSAIVNTFAEMRQSAENYRPEDFIPTAQGYEPTTEAAEKYEDLVPTGRAHE